MEIKFTNDKNIKYSLYEAKDHSAPNDWMIMLEKEKYLILEINSVEPGICVKSITTSDTKLLALDVDYYAIKKVDKVVNLTATFGVGYRFEVKCDQKRNYLNDRCYKKKGDFVYLRITDGFEDEKISNIEILNSDTNKPVDFPYTLEDFMFHGNLTDRTLSFKMPKYPVLVRIHYVHNEKMATLKFDLSNIKELSYENTDHGNSLIYNFVTDAQYSDDYDFGAEDEHIYAFEEYHYQFGQIRITLYLMEKVDVTLLLNGKELKYELKVSEEKISNGDTSVIAYEYDFIFVRFNESGTISFKIK